MLKTDVLGINGRISGSERYLRGWKSCLVLLWLHQCGTPPPPTMSLCHSYNTWHILLYVTSCNDLQGDPISKEYPIINTLRFQRMVPMGFSFSPIKAHLWWESLISLFSPQLFPAPSCRLFIRSEAFSVVKPGDSSFGGGGGGYDCGSFHPMALYSLFWEQAWVFQSI